MRKVTFLLLSALLPLSLMAQDIRVVRGDCMPDSEGDVAAARGPRRLSIPTFEWDADRVYHQLVILISFSDKDFQSEDPRGDYDKMLNEEGYNKRNGPGCMAEYFRVQSGGLFNLKFDVYGPYKVGSKAQPYNNPDVNTRNYGRDQMRAATNMFLAENPDVDFSQYDWEGNGVVNQVIYITAGYSGNQSNAICYGYIWPNTSSFSPITTPDSKTIANYSCSAEVWSNNASCGIGTICHEYSHSLGLPDIYPTSSSSDLPYSVVDEWDLMDGGNFTNYGWCPPNYSPLEKMLLRWITPIELTEPVTVKDLKPVADGGKAYIVKNTDSEYYLLENRQWNGWDAGLPGQGLVIYHVNYVSSIWSTNSVNNTKGAPMYELVHADNMDYDGWDNYLHNNGYSSQYAHSGRMNNLHLSGSTYPYGSDPETLVNQLTDTSVPAAVTYNANKEGEKLMSKPITNIRMSDEGLISFDFMGGDSTVGVKTVAITRPAAPAETYDLQGRRAVVGSQGLLIMRQADGTIRKIAK